MLVTSTKIALICVIFMFGKTAMTRKAVLRVSAMGAVVLH